MTLSSQDRLIVAIQCGSPFLLLLNDSLAGMLAGLIASLASLNAGILLDQRNGGEG